MADGQMIICQPVAANQTGTTTQSNTDAQQQVQVATQGTGLSLVYQLKPGPNNVYGKISNISCTKSQTYMIFVSSCSGFCPIY